MVSVLGTYFLYYFIIISSTIIAWILEVFKKRLTKKTLIVLLILAAVIPVFISSVRYGIGTDYYNYTKIYNILSFQYSGILDAYLNSRYEISWIIINELAEKVFNNPQYIFVISSILIWLFSFKAIYDNRERIHIGIAVLILLCIFYNISFNIIRQALAISVIMLSIKPLIDKRIIKYILIVLFASTFHLSAIITLPLYFIINSKNKSMGTIKNVITPIIFIIVLVFIQPVISFFTNFELFSGYGVYNLEYRAFAKRDIILKLPIVIMFLLNYKKLKDNNNLMYKIGIVFILGVLMTFLRSYANYVDRIAMFFDITQIFIVAAIVKLQNNKYKRFMYISIIIIYYLAWFTYNFLYLGRHETIPYQWIFNL